ncbi:MAG: PAS domain S-box protein [Firmicutes bacterium]|nr:PAS domain S-box protein [Bacillota bacterium]
MTSEDMPRKELSKKLADLHQCIARPPDAGDESQTHEDTHCGMESVFYSLFKHSIDFVHILDTSGTIFQTNPASVVKSGYSEEELIGKNLDDFLSPLSALKFREALPVLTTQKTIRSESEFICKDGSVLNFECSIISIPDKKNETAYFIVFQKDITYRKLTEAKLLENERKYRTIFELSPEAIVLLNSEGTVIEVNGRMFEWLGYKPEEAVGKNLMELPFLPAESKSTVAKNFAIRQQGIGIPIYEIDFVSKNGGKRLGRIFASVIVDAKGKTQFEMVVIYDITEQRMKEATIAEEKNRLSVTLECIADAFLATDIEGNILMFNRQAENITGWRMEEVRGKYMCDVLLFQDQEGKKICENLCPIFKSPFYSSENNPVFVKSYILAKDGRRIPIELSAAPIRDERGKASGLVQLFRDRTKQVELEHMKEEFVAAITHDLKSPLASMMGFAQLMEDPRYGEISEKKLEFLNHIRRSGDFLLDLIKNIVGVHRVETGLLNYIFEDFSFEEFLKDIKETFEPLANGAGIKLDFSCPEGVWIKADRSRIKQVFHNLIDNALRYTPKGGTISIKTAPSADQVEIEVADTGKGIPKSEQDKLFQKFVQVKGERRGTGLGLYIVKNLLQGHGSGITLWSEPGVGTRFSFSLPAGAIPPKITFRPGIILIVGGDAESADLAITVLKDDGHTVEWARGGLEALQKIPSFKPDLTIVHHLLPDLTVEEFLYALKSNPYAEKIITGILSPVSLPELKGQFDFYIPMPLDLNSLHGAVQKALAR